MFMTIHLVILFFVPCGGNHKFYECELYEKFIGNDTVDDLFQYDYHENTPKVNISKDHDVEINKKFEL